MVGLNQSADFILVEDLQTFKINEVYVRGNLVSKAGNCLIPSIPIPIVNQFNALPIVADELRLNAITNSISVIEAIDGPVDHRRRVMQRMSSVDMLSPMPARYSQNSSGKQVSYS
jgi:adenine deaminase